MAHVRKLPHKAEPVRLVLMGVSMSGAALSRRNAFSFVPRGNSRVAWREHDGIEARN